MGSTTGLKNWLVSGIRSVSIEVAKAHSLAKVMWLTDSTFQAHDYKSSDEESLNIFVQHMGGTEKVVEIGLKDTVATLKEKIAANDNSLEAKSLGLRGSG